MPNLLQRYKSGDHIVVWNELLRITRIERPSPHFDEAQDIARATMALVKNNLLILADRLNASGYRFGMYPDGRRQMGYAGPLGIPLEDFEQRIVALEASVGPIPLSLRAFWEIVGSVNFTGCFPGWNDGYLDPLVIYPIEITESECAEQVEDNEDSGEQTFWAPIGPDALHKANVSGGVYYRMTLPNDAADGVVLEEPHQLHLVQYLRLACRWAGLPGLEKLPVSNLNVVALTTELKPF